MRIIWTILAMTFGAGFLSACDMMKDEPMAAEGAAMAEGEVASEEMAPDTEM